VLDADTESEYIGGWGEGLGEKEGEVPRTCCDMDDDIDFDVTFCRGGMVCGRSGGDMGVPLGSLCQIRDIMSLCSSFCG
jgi:hypothetical protein